MTDDERVKEIILKIMIENNIQTSEELKKFLDDEKIDFRSYLMQSKTKEPGLGTQDIMHCLLRVK